MEHSMENSLEYSMEYSVEYCMAHPMESAGPLGATRLRGIGCSLQSASFSVYMFTVCNLLCLQFEVFSLVYCLQSTTLIFIYIYNLQPTICIYICSLELCLRRGSALDTTTTS